MIGFIIGVVPQIRKFIIGGTAPLRVILDSASFMGYIAKFQLPDCRFYISNTCQLGYECYRFRNYFSVLTKFMIRSS